MNIKQAKQEVVDTVEAYLMKDEYGEYVIPSVHQRPVLLLGAPGIGKTQIMEQTARECGVALVHDHTPHQTECDRTSVYFEEGIRRQGILGDRIYDERDRCKYL